MSEEDRQAIDQRKQLIKHRARALAEDAVEKRPAWLRRLGQPPSKPSVRESWLSEVSTVAAYRDRYGIISDIPVGSRSTSQVQESERQRALQSVRAAATLANRVGRSRPVVASTAISGP
jgi:hypothetical protein